MKMLSLSLLLLLPTLAFTDSVIPIDAVKENVNIRMSPDAASEIVGKLDRGSSAKLVDSIDGWYEIQIEGGATGFISADWTQVVADEVVAESSTTGQGPGVEQADAVGEGMTTEVVAESASDVAADAVEEVAEEVVEAIEDDVRDAAAPPAGVVEADEPSVADVTPPAIEDSVSVDDSRMELKGRKNYLVKFRDESRGGNSQIYDDGNRIGIGTTEPKQRLEVNGSIQIHEQNSSVAGLIITQSSGDTGYIMHNQASTLTIGAGSVDRITVDRDGHVGIAVARPRHPLEMASGAHVTAGGAWTNSSSRDRKENIASLSVNDATEALMQLDPVTFSYQGERGEDYVGFIAEDVPALVATTDRNAISTMDIVAVLTRVVQQQQMKIEALEARLDAR